MNDHGRLRLTPQDIRSVQFPASRFGTRGYREEQVDEFLDLVAETLAGRDRELARARAEINRVKNWREDHNIPEQGVRTPTPEEVHLYSRAQLAAEALEDRARRVLAQADATARQRYAEIMHQAAERTKVLGVHASVIRAQLRAQLLQLAEEVQQLGAAAPVDHELPANGELPGAHRLRDDQVHGTDVHQAP
ncbi:DivIVA domain-containing protein [Umezawaea sp. Da 62-37]|uniref:DivIVA domain-containing protein n=1 Tax=Umezawaea sp. Da 62-37 TaxID=3075927 RepID=UPI0028F70317|nr:DivIVA domain-containing protein [Umezawaea sp. Da 62-37]WNV83482.1 DivIVA domain-containing protein [Umezawaea sp. Da 62-37]